MLSVRRRQFIILLGTTMATWPLAARAQQPALPVIGFLDWGSAGQMERVVVAFRQGLASAGYVEGRNVAIEFRWADSQGARVSALAKDLVDRRVALIFTGGWGGPARIAKAATSTIPIVFAYGGDPVADGLVASFNRPGGNVTGATFIGTQLLSKRMGLLREILPQISDVALLVNPKGTLAEAQISEAKAAAQSLGLNLHIVSTTSESEFDEAFATMRRLKVGAFLPTTDPLFGFSGKQLHVKKGLSAGIPPICVGRHDVAAGGLFSYGPNLPDTWHQAGLYVGRILKGEKPSDLPVVQPTKFEFVINLKAARELGIDVPPALLSRADDVIE
jgi:putative tryptophan/tyrosine transport system substrate-binding protein